MSKLVIPGVIASAGGSGGGGGSVTVDSALSPTSENPVQNKVITNALENVYTQDNLVAGTNISITRASQPVFDENTLGVWHLDDETGANAITTGAYAQTTLFTESHIHTTSFSKFGTGSCLINTTNVLSSAALLLNINSTLASSNFTVDMWGRTPTGNNQNYKLTITFGMSPELYIYLANNRIQIGSNQTSTTAGTWHHLAIERYNNTLNGYVDGTLIYTASTSQTASFDIKVTNENQSYIPGACLDEVRLSNVARYQGQNFTPFEVAYSADFPPQYQINNTQDLSNYLQNTATGTDALTILGTATNIQGAINIGKNSQATQRENVAIGYNSKATGTTSTAIGVSTSATGYVSTAIGYATARGYGSMAINGGNANSANADANYTIQIGGGTNSTQGTLQVTSYTLLNLTTGKIPAERLPSVNSIEVTDTMPTPSSSNVGQVKLYSGTTTSNFTNGYLYQCKLESTLEETVTFDSDKISAPAEMFWFIVKMVLPETYSSVTNGNVTYSESANLVTFTFKDANNNVLGQFPGDVGELSSVGFTFNNLTDGDVINFTCFSGMVESYEWTPLIVQESSEIKIYNAPSWSRNTTLFPNCRLSLPNIDDLTEYGMFRVRYTESDETGAMDLDYLCNVSPLNASGTIIGIFQSLQVIYPAVGVDSGINATLYRAKLSGGTWSDWKSSLVTSVSSNSTYSEYVSAKLFYDTCGNIEALINAL